MSVARPPRFVQHYVADAAAERAQVLRGLLARPAQASPKFFYDKLGSHLFEAITELPEYYPTRTEAAIFAAHGADMARRIGTGSTLIDLGAGNCAKAARLFPLLEPRSYLAIDVSVEFLREALRRLQREHPQIEHCGLGLDFSTDLAIPDALVPHRPVFFYPGSSIGNFEPAQALDFLRRIRERAAGGGLLIGVDLVKPKPLLDAAYDDELGVTAAFNLNLLRHLNRIAGTDFLPRQWRHVAFFDAAASRIEMHLEARESVEVRWREGARRFEAGERIHTENSCKYRVDEFGAMLQRAGFAAPAHWTDPHGAFAVFWATP
jgi:dimethylhistidine N-methyltransferase